MSDVPEKVLTVPVPTPDPAWKFVVPPAAVASVVPPCTRDDGFPLALAFPPAPTVMVIAEDVIDAVPVVTVPPRPPFHVNEVLPLPPPAPPPTTK